VLRSLAGEFQSKTGVLTVVEIDDVVASEVSTIAGDVVQVTSEASRTLDATRARRRAGSPCIDEAGTRLEVDDDGDGSIR